ncbi:MAG: DUF1761 family protein [Bacteroidetes bacterium]|nr:DUF1761 family protein [Bacteroidota bacterium]
MLEINYLAVVVATVVNFIIGFLWYTPLFGKAWGREMGYDMNEKPDPKVLMKGMAFMIIGNFLMSWVLAHNMGAWSFVPGSDASNALGTGLSAAIFTWLGFYFPNDLGSTVWERKSWKLFGINTGYHFVSLLVVALILSHWK